MKEIYDNNSLFWNVLQGVNRNFNLCRDYENVLGMTPCSKVHRHTLVKHSLYSVG